MGSNVSNERDNDPAANASPQWMQSRIMPTLGNMLQYSICDSLSKKKLRNKLDCYMVVGNFKGTDSVPKHVLSCCPFAVGHPICLMAQSHRKSMESELRV